MDQRDAKTRQYFNQRLRKFASPGSYSLGGEVLDARNAAWLTGAPDGADISLEIVSEAGAKAAVLSLSHAFFDQPAHFRIEAGETGFVILTNEILMLKKQYQRGKLGLRMFAHQAQAAHEFGIAHIWLRAAGSPQNKAYNGYYTWARYGFEPYPSVEDQAMFNERFPGVSNLRELMSTASGRARWKEFGFDQTMCFDLSSTDCINTLKSYMAESGVKI
ncbi:MAG: hypothetical protein V4582_09945 [Pseudomonadota bacterium]